MRCKYCKSDQVRVNREYNHKTKRWESVALCQNCGCSFKTENISCSLSAAKVFFFLLFLLFFSFFAAGFFEIIMPDELVETHLKLGAISAIIFGIMLLLKIPQFLIKKLLSLIYKALKKAFHKIHLIIQNKKESKKI